MPDLDDIVTVLLNLPFVFGLVVQALFSHPLILIGGVIIFILCRIHDKMDVNR